ncbi:hypothetical protein [Streptomyces olivoreticuli]|uniref:hypothetical protein n=1 Tax=Streptomyces olivoreticuli TaxID=68246 RepID=UPI000E26BA7D|nr:hypothetical protein [Streptomyces olivoreticuli]
MGNLQREQELDVMVTYNNFCIQESYDTRVPIPYPDGAEGGVFLKAFPMRLDLGSAGHTHRASVKVEVWDAEAELKPQAWDEVAEATLESVSGELAVWSMERAPDVITLGEPGLWRVRVAATGRDEVLRQTTDVGPVHGVERWLFQFWPAES